MTLQAQHSKTFRVRAFGERACFTRPELKVERVSYEVMTPSAARGVLEAIFWKPAIAWQIRRIEVHAPIRFLQLKRNEVGKRAISPDRYQVAGDKAYSLLESDNERQQRNTMYLADVDYVIEANFSLTERAGPDENFAKFEAIFERRLSKGQCFHRPYLGCREFACDVEPADPERRPAPLTKPLGLMLHDIEFGDVNRAHFFEAKLHNGVLDVPPFLPGRLAGAAVTS